MKRYAGIDIGSNTILMAILESDGSGKLTLLEDMHEIARLGEKVDQLGFLQQSAIERAAGILRNYRAVCDKYKVDYIIASATSAMRDAENGAETATQFADILAAEVNIIEGKEEASVSFLGSIDYGAFHEYKSNTGEKRMVIDIGGGSTEIITGSGLEYGSAVSINIGSVRLTEKFFGQHPPKQTEIENASEFIRNEYIKSGFNPGVVNQVTAVAGTATTLASIAANIREFDSKAINGMSLNKDTIDEVFHLLLSITTREIIDKCGVHPKRADVITAGALILKNLTELAGFGTCRVSVQGLRYGLIFNKLLNEQPQSKFRGFSKV